MDRQTPPPFSISTAIGNFANGVVDMFRYGFRRMSNGFRRVFYNDPETRQDFVGFGINNFLSSGAWLLPTTFVSTGLLFRHEIETIAENLFGK